MAVWIRLPGLAIEYYDRQILGKIGNLVGKTLKVDVNTAVQSRGKFARLCVEIDLSKPLTSKYMVNEKVHCIEYEGIHLICFNCGRFGHEHAECPEKKKASILHMEDQSQPVPGTEVQPPTLQTREGAPVGEERSITGIPKKDKGKQVITEDDSSYGPWMMVQKPQRNKCFAKGESSTAVAGSGAKGKSYAVVGDKSHFSILQVEEAADEP